MRRLALLVLGMALLWPVTAWAQFDGGVLLRGTIDHNTSGDKTLVAAAAGKSVRVFQWLLICNGANNIIIKDTTPTTLLPVVNLNAGGSVVLDNNNGVAWFQTAEGKGLVLNLSAAQQCSGFYLYTQG